MRPLTFDGSDDDERTGEIATAGDSIRAIFEACGYTENLFDQKAKVVCKEVVAERFGKEASSLLTVRDLREGQLIIEVGKAAWRHRLSLEAPALIQAINHAVGSEAVTSIRLM